jgi:hypothetical protein
MQIKLNTPQRVTIVVEKNKSGTWSVAAYLITAEGHRSRRSLGVFDTYTEAAESLEQAWQRTSL